MRHKLLSETKAPRGPKLDYIPGEARVSTEKTFVDLLDRYLSVEMPSFFDRKLAITQGLGVCVTIYVKKKQVTSPREAE